jgi:hypothetical protein
MRRRKMQRHQQRLRSCQRTRQRAS